VARRRSRGNERTLPDGDALIELAASLLDDHGHDSFAAAKRSAARRLGCSEAQAARVDNRAIADVLRERQSTPEHAQMLAELRREALRAMRLLADFDPRAVGSLADGLHLGEPGFALHLVADTPEEVLLFLATRRIPARSAELRQRFSGGAERDVPCLSFRAGELWVRLLVFAPGDARAAPLAEIDGKPLQRLKLAQLEALLAE
jgi:hypothetical protein